jgi:hypothetical protein
MLFVSLLGLQSCATLYSGPRQLISINSIPQGALVKLNGKDIGYAPVYIPVRKSYKKKTIELSKGGYVPGLPHE